MRNPLRNKNILITCGPSWVAVDAMRVLSNRSSGRLGHLVALECKKAKAKVTVLEGAVFDQLNVKGIKKKTFTFFDELEKLLKAELKKKYDVIIHAAAVSDYKPRKAHQKKISSDLRPLRLNLVPTRKLIQSIKRTRDETVLVGFKLEPSLTQRSAKSKAMGLLNKARCDLVVANSIGARAYQGYIFNKKGMCLAKAASRAQMARKLVKILEKGI